MLAIPTLVRSVSGNISFVFVIFRKSELNAPIGKVSTRCRLFYREKLSSFKLLIKILADSSGDPNSVAIVMSGDSGGS